MVLGLLETGLTSDVGRRTLKAASGQCIASIPTASGVLAREALLPRTSVRRQTSDVRPRCSSVRRQTSDVRPKSFGRRP